LDTLADAPHSALSGVARVFDNCSSLVDGIVESARSQQRGLNDSEIEMLAAAWAKVLTDVTRLAGADAAQRINGGV
jgi:hypothetical protein